MPKFIVQFASTDGKLGYESVDAASEAAAVAAVEASGLTPITVRGATGRELAKSEQAAARGRSRRGRRGRLRRALIDFTHQLAAVTESGIPIVAGLRAVAEQTGHPTLRGAISRIVGRIEGGRTLADALAAEPELFSTLFVKTVAAGETAGKLPEVLLALARYQEQEAETRAQVRTALLYPGLVTASLIGATVFMLIFVVPQFAVMFARFNGQLPLPTRMLLATSSLLTRHYLWVLTGVVLLVFVLRKLAAVPFIRARIHERMLRLPVFGNLFLNICMVRFVELLDLLMQAALPITQSIRVTADSMTNEAIQKDVRGMLASVEGGRSLTEAFAQAKHLTPLVKRMLAIGEQAGRTDQIFAYLRTYYATQTQRSIKLLSTLIEPVLVAGLAAVVLFFALAIFLPMWKLLKIVGTA